VEGRAVTLVTISATYGSGGSLIAPALAERLGVPFLGRPPGPDLDAEVEEPRGHLLSRLASLGLAWGTPAGMELDELMPDHAERERIEQEVRELAAGGEGVILGRGAAILLHEDERVLHVLLDGPRAARVRQAMEIGSLDHETAERQVARVDRFRRAYIETLYGVDLKEAGVCQLVLDSTALPREDCVELIARAALARAGRVS
jgi:cytidylate kinase